MQALMELLIFVQLTTYHIAMKRQLLHLLAAIAIFVPAQLSASTQFPQMNREEARLFVNQIAQMSRQALDSQLSAKLGPDANVTLTVEDSTFLYTFAMPSFIGMSNEMAQFMISANRPQGSNIQQIKALCRLLDMAGYDIGYKFCGIDTIKATMPTSRFLDLMSKPIDQLGFDKSQLLNEFTDMFARSMDADNPLPDTSSSNVALEGHYLTLHWKLNNEQPMLADSKLNKSIKTNIAKSLLGSPKGDLVRSLAKSAQALQIKGLRYNVSDRSGNQRVITLTWDELERLAALPSDLSEAERQISLGIEFLNNDIKNHVEGVSFSFQNAPPVLTFTIDYDFDNEQFLRILKATPEQHVTDTFSPLLKQVLPAMPEVTTVKFILKNPFGLARQTEYPSSKFTKSQDQ